MAVLYCWKTGELGICADKEIPDGTVDIMHGLANRLRDRMVGTAEHDPVTRNFYAPGVRQLGDDDQFEDAKFALVQAYSGVLHKRKKK